MANAGRQVGAEEWLFVSAPMGMGFVKKRGLVDTKKLFARLL